MRPRHPALALALALTASLAACSTATSTPSPSPPTTAPPSAPPVTAPATPAASARPLAEVYAEIRTQVATIRGMQPTDAVEPVVIDAGQLSKNLEAEFDATHPAGSLTDTEDLLITLGLLPPDSSLRALTLAFQAGQVAGYYSPEKDQLFVVSRTTAVGPADESTYAHEFTHQLQDQRFDLDALGIDDSDQSDRSLARLALVEGDATSVQTTWMTEHLTPAELGEVFAAALDPAAMAAFNNAPPYLRETALFPYQDGLALVMRLLGTGGYAAVDAAFADPPDSTEQVLHPDKYVTREAPVVVEIPDGIEKRLGAGWSEVGQDTLGELLIRVWLKIGGRSTFELAKEAAGWGGDRLALYRDANGETIVVLVSVWDSIGDAQEFSGAVLAVEDATRRDIAVSESGNRVAIALASAGALAKVDAALDFDLSSIDTK